MEINHIAQLLKRTMNGSDGLIRKIVINSGLKAAEITVSVMDVNDGYEWINILFKVSGIQEFRVTQPARMSNEVSSSGINCKQLGNTFFLDFSPYSEESEELADFRKSDIYFACLSIDCETLPYSEE